MKRTRRQVVRIVIFIGLASVATNYRSGPTRSEAASLPPAFLDTPIAPRPATSPTTIARGKQVYESNCAQCHGVSGAGDGYCASWLSPWPGDFVEAQYKFRTTPSGMPPSDEDLFRTISRGVNGTGMPPWMQILSGEDRWALVDHLKTLSPLFSHGMRTQPAMLPPRPSSPRSVRNGRAVYEKMECARCHGEEGRGGGPAAEGLVDAKGRRFSPRDFTQAQSFRTGWNDREIVRTLETGLNGTPMASYAGVMDAKEEYDLAAYVMSLAKRGRRRQRPQTSGGVEAPDRPDRIVALPPECRPTAIPRVHTKAER